MSALPRKRGVRLNQQLLKCISDVALVGWEARLSALYLETPAVNEEMLSKAK